MTELETLAVRIPDRPRTRFAPVKTTNDLLVVRSDAYELTPDGRTLLVTTHRSGQAEIIAVPMPRAN